MPKILVVEDDAELSQSLRSTLESNGYEVDLVCTGDDGLHWLKQGHYAAAVVDWNLPHMTGVEICRQYRGSGGGTKILMLTGMTQTDNIVEGLDSGADDYLGKPFQARELLARIQSLCRRGESFKSTIISAGIIKLDLQKRACWVDETMIVLPRREFSILELLMQNQGHIFNAEKIIDYVWPTGTDTAADAIRVHLTRLRQRLKAVNEEAGMYLVNVYGEGYKFEKPSVNPEKQPIPE